MAYIETCDWMPSNEPLENDCGALLPQMTRIVRLELPSFHYVPDTYQGSASEVQSMGYCNNKVLRCLAGLELLPPRKDQGTLTALGLLFALG